MNGAGQKMTSKDARKPVPKRKLALALTGVVLALALRAYLNSDAGSQVPIEFLAVPVLLLGLASLALGLLASERLLMRTVTRTRRWHSPRAIRVLYVICGTPLALLGLSALLFG